MLPRGSAGQHGQSVQSVNAQSIYNVATLNGESMAQNGEVMTQNRELGTQNRELRISIESSRALNHYI